MASTFIPAGLVLKESVIQRVLRMDILEESVTYQSIKRQGLEQGLGQGLERGLEQGQRSLIIRQLESKIGQIPADTKSQINQLSFAQLEQLGEALLNFSTLSNLTHFLNGLAA